MNTFHDNKLWQKSYVAAMDMLGIVGDSDNYLLAELRRHSLMVVTVIADGVTRKDKQEMEAKLRDAQRIVVALRSLLSVAWGQEVISDEQFQTLESAYEDLGKQLH